LPPLIEALRNDRAWMRQRAAAVLQRIGAAARAAVPALIDVLKDPDVEARIRAADALGGIGPEARAAVPALIDALQDEGAIVSGGGWDRYTETVKGTAAWALKRIDPEAAARAGVS